MKNHHLLGVASWLVVGAFVTSAYAGQSYYERGQGNPFGRVGYSASRILVTHGDSGHAQFNLSEAAGTAVAATFSNAYYPTAQRTMSGTLSRWGTQLMWDALSNQLKEFWPDVRRRLDRPKRLTP
jgi:hypothetical protein